MITIPSQHYIGLKAERETESSLPLAFATPFGTDAAYEKRKSTVDNWCRGYGHYVGGKYVYPEFESDVHDNVLMEGFRIAESVRRIGWNGGNVVWRVVDPRGFELEISSANFARIIDCTTIINGEIKGKCIWGRDGAANVLLPEASDPYQQATANTKRSTMKVDAKSLAVGDEVEFKDGQIWIYAGVYTTLSRKEKKIERGASYYDRITAYSYTIDAKKRHVFVKPIDKEYAVTREYQMNQVGKKEGDYRFYVIADTKKVALITKKAAAVINADEIAADMTKQYEKYSNVVEAASTDYMSFAMIPGTVKVEDVIMSIEPAVDNAEYTKLVTRGGIWYTANSNSSYNAGFALYPFSTDLGTRTYTQQNRSTLTLSTLDDGEVFNFVITHKDNKYRF